MITSRKNSKDQLIWYYETEMMINGKKERIPWISATSEQGLQWSLNAARTRRTATESGVIEIYDKVLM